MKALDQANIHIDKLANQTDALKGVKLSHLDLKDALSTFTVKDFALRLADNLSHLFNAEKFASLMIKETGKTEKETSDSLKGWLNFSAGLIFDYYKDEAGAPKLHIKGIDSKRFIQRFPQLSNKTLLGLTLRGVVVSIASDVAYELGYLAGKWIAQSAAKEIHSWFVGEKNSKELYEQEWFVKSADTILPVLLQDLTGDKLHSVIALNYLFTATFKTFTLENSADLFGSEEYKDFDADKVLAAYQKVHALLSGNQSAQSVNSLNDLAAALKSNEVQELFKLHRGSEILVLNEQTAETVLDSAAEDSANKLAARYALKNLNPFMIKGKTIDYSRFNENGELELYSPANPNGMTDVYMKQRAKMLETLIAWPKSDPFVITDTDMPFNPNPLYHDLASDAHAIMYKVGTPVGPYIIFGTDQNDAEGLVGGGQADYLFGGSGHDTLDGKEGSDYMEGGTGSDSYHILHNDTVFDADGKGALFFNGVQVGKLNRLPDSVNRWESEQMQDNEPMFSAFRKNDDLVIVSANNRDEVTVQDFFVSATAANGGLSALGVSLDKASRDERPTSHTLAGGEHFNYFRVNAGTSAQVTGGQFDDFLSAVYSNGVLAYMGDGNDRVYGSYRPDSIRGGNGNDMLYGTAFITSGKTADELAQDRDLLIGGNGSDLIHGMFGNDVIHTGNEGEHSSSLPSGSATRQGDWALGGTGNDRIYGSRDRDFLQGGEGSDAVHGGADDDVILGDGNVQFGNKAFRLNGTQAALVFHQNGVMETYPGQAVGKEYDTLAGSTREQWMYSFDALDKANANWTMSADLDAQTPDYTVSPSVPFRSNEHRVSQGGAGDYLYGGAGNDLIVGQDGNDFLWGDEGNDVLFGDDNRDPQISGNDRLFGGAGDDRLYGGLGNNVLEGGEGDDTYWISAAELAQADAVHNTVRDSDKRGKIVVAGKSLAASWYLDLDSRLWRTEGSDLRLREFEGHLLMLDGQDRIFGVVEDFKSGDLGIALVNRPPQLNELLKSQQIKAGEFFELRLGTPFKDEQMDKLSYRLTLQGGSPLPQWLHFDPTSMTLSGTPSAADTGNLALQITAVDHEGLSNQQNWSLEIIRKNEAPYPTAAAAPALTLAEDSVQQVSFAPWFRDDDSPGSLSYTLESADGTPLPDWVAYDNGSVSLNPGFDAAGSYRFRVTATDSEGAQTSVDWAMQVENTNRAPLVTGSVPDQVLQANTEWRYTLPLSFSDPDSGESAQLSYRLETADGSPLPSWLNYDAATQTLSGKADAAGVLNLSLSATDPYGDRAAVPFVLDVRPAPTPPAGTTVSGTRGNDVLTGNAGSDRLDGGAGNDTLRGGKGNDVLLGGAGNDTYVFATGDGKDVIRDTGGSDTLLLEGIRPQQLWLSREGRDLLIRTIGTQDSITVENYYASFQPALPGGNPAGIPSLASGKLESVRLSNGSSIGTAQINRLVQAMAAFRPQQGTSAAPLSEQMQNYASGLNVAAYWQA